MGSPEQLLPKFESPTTEKIIKEESKQEVPEDNLSLEQQEKPHEFKFEITDHSVRNGFKKELKNKKFYPEEFKRLCEQMKASGVSSIRTDCDWNLTEQYGQAFLDRYRQEKEIMEGAGLEAPTIILSNPSAEMIKLNKEDKSKFFSAWREYANQVKDMLVSGRRQKSFAGTNFK